MAGILAVTWKIHEQNDASVGMRTGLLGVDLRTLMKWRPNIWKQLRQGALQTKDPNNKPKEILETGNSMNAYKSTVIEESANGREIWTCLPLFNFVLLLYAGRQELFMAKYELPCQGRWEDSW